MRLYAAYLDPASLDRDKAAVLVKQGMCWPAFLFSFPWALRHRMWMAAALMFAGAAALLLALRWLGADEGTAAFAWLGLASFVGLSANDWRGRVLERRGLRLTALIAAEDAERAALRLFDGRWGAAP